MAALGAAIHVFGAASKDVDGRHEAGHDDNKSARSPNSLRHLIKFVPQMCDPGSPHAGEVVSFLYQNVRMMSDPIVN
jgi:hypothetical protein